MFFIVKQMRLVNAKKFLCPKSKICGKNLSIITYLLATSFASIATFHQESVPSSGLKK